VLLNPLLEMEIKALSFLHPLSNTILIRWVEVFKNNALLSSQFIFLEEHVVVIFAFSGRKERGDQI